MPAYNVKVGGGIECVSLSAGANTAPLVLLHPSPEHNYLIPTLPCRTWPSCTASPPLTL